MPPHTNNMSLAMFVWKDFFLYMIDSNGVFHTSSRHQRHSSFTIKYI